MTRVAFYGNHAVSYSSETHHANSLEELGVEVVRLQEPKTPWRVILSEASKSDLFVWIKTHGWETPHMDRVLAELKRKGVPVVSYHLDAYRQIPDRWKRYQNDPYMRSLDHFFTVDQLLADWLNENTNTRGHYLPPGVYGAECYISDQPSEYANDVLFVGSYGYHSSYPMRPQLVDWLHATYKDRFTHIGGGSKTVTTLRGHALNAAYANSKVAVGDSYICDPNYQGKYWSDRVPESLGRGAFLAHPWVYGLDEQFIPGEHLATYRWGDFTDLKRVIDHYLANDGERERIRNAGHEHAKATASYKVRWQHILDVVGA